MLEQNLHQTQARASDSEPAPGTPCLPGGLLKLPHEDVPLPGHDRICLVMPPGITGSDEPAARAARNACRQ